MDERFDLIVRNGTVVTPAGRREADIGVREGRFGVIADRGTLAGATAAQELDATGRHVLPGAIDGHVHFREPGFEHKEDWLTGSRAAVMGGIATVLEMPNTQPPTRSAVDARAKADLAAAKAYCDFGLFGVVDAEYDVGIDAARLEELVGSGLVIGLKVFMGPTTGGLATPEDSGLLQALTIARGAGLRVAFHAEDGAILMQVGELLGWPREPIGHLESRPPIAEVTAIDHVGGLLEQSGARGHICHLSSAAGLEALQRWRERGLDLTSEVTAHHVFLGRDEYARLGGQIKVNPPIRGEPDASALLAALADGRVDSIASDHAPHMPSENLADDINDVLAGISGVETTLPLFLTAVSEGRLTLERLADATSAAPARIWGLTAKGSIEVGRDADLTIIDLARPGAIRGAELHSKHPLTPFEGRPTVGAVSATVVRGEIVMRDGQLGGTPGSGTLVSRD